MTKYRPSKRERLAASALGHSHSPPTNSKAIRKANLQALAAGKRFAKSDTPSVIARAGEKSPSIKAWIPQAQGSGKLKPKAIPRSVRKFEGDVPYMLDVELVDMRKERAGPNPPLRKYRMADTKLGNVRHGFRKFNPSGKA